jgi:hypothetical protein
MVMNIPIPETVDGRILFEAMIDNVDLAAEQVSESFETGHFNSARCLRQQDLVTLITLDGGWRTR